MHMDSYNPFCEVDDIILDLVGFMSVVCRYLSYKMMYLMTESLPLIWMLLTMYRLHHKKVKLYQTWASLNIKGHLSR